MQIRTAVQQDLPSVKQLYTQLNQALAGYQPDDFTPDLQSDPFFQELLGKPEYEVLVAEEDGRVVGIAALKEAHTPPYALYVPRRFAYLMDLCVHADYRGKHIGTQLLDAAKAWTRQRGLEYLELTVLEENRGAAALYQREGFRPTQHRLRYTPEEKPLEEGKRK